MKRIRGTRFKDYTGITKDCIEVIKLDRIEGNKTYWLCKCHKCGEEKVLERNTIYANKTCGCRMPYNNRERLYVLWMGMRQRCENPNHISYKYYGEKGITVCPEWRDNYLSFRRWAFETGYDETLPRGAQTIERKDPKMGYSPENCEWKTIQQQQRNKVNTRLFEYNGEKHTITEWSEITGTPHDVLHARIYLGWDVKDAIERPIGKTHGENFIYVNYNGEEKSLLEISKEFGISYSALLKRHKKGISIEDTIKEYQENGGSFVKRYEFNGEKHTVPEWAKILGVNEQMLLYRLSTGRPYEQVFTSEKNYKRKYERKAEV